MGEMFNVGNIIVKGVLIRGGSKGALEVLVLPILLSATLVHVLGYKQLKRGLIFA